jgi:hypothetical protein
MFMDECCNATDVLKKKRGRSERRERKVREGE